MRVQKSIDIAASPQQVWPFFVAPEKVLQWCITFKKFEYTGEQRGGVWTMLNIEEQAAGPVMKMQFKITECKENEKLALQMVAGTGVRAYEQSWSLEPSPAGSRFTFREEIELPFGIIGKLLGLILEPMSAGTVDKMLVKLKTLAES
jgi:uncharacterized protein YndB with AHSA1/START domain